MAITYNLDVEFSVEVDNTDHGKLSLDRDDVSCDEFLGPQYYEIADGASDVTINLGPLTTAACLVLVCDQAITFKANTYGPFTVVPNVPVVLPNITALAVSNATGSTGKLKVAAAGT